MLLISCRTERARRRRGDRRFAGTVGVSGGHKWGSVRVGARWGSVGVSAHCQWGCGVARDFLKVCFENIIDGGSGLSVET